jgi:hypothetical protein
MYIETEIFLENTQLKDLGVDTEIAVRMILNTEDISAVRESIDDEGEVIENECTIYLLTGSIFTINSPYDEIKNKLLC